jgi:hypothetical protein
MPRVRQGEAAGWQSMCGEMGNGMPVRSPKRAIRVWKLLGVMGHRVLR